MIVWFTDVNSQNAKPKMSDLQIDRNISEIKPIKLEQNCMQNMTWNILNWAACQRECNCPYADLWMLAMASAWCDQKFRLSMFCRFGLISWMNGIEWGFKADYPIGDEDFSNQIWIWLTRRKPNPTCKRLPVHAQLQQPRIANQQTILHQVAQVTVVIVIGLAYSESCLIPLKVLSR